VHSSRIKAFVVIGVSASLLTLAACGKDDPNASASASPSAAAATSESSASSESPSASPTPSAKPVKASNNFNDVAVTGAYGKSPKVKVKSPWVIDQTRTKVLAPSKGPAIAAGSTVEVDYYGVDARTGKKFDDSFSRGAPVSFPLDRVVPGFSKGLTGQRQGSRVLIAMPGKDGYDSSGGNPQAGINVGDTLIFVVDIVSVPLAGPEGKKVPPKAGLPTVTDKGGVPEITVPKTDPPTELQVQPLIKGTGKAVGQSDTITFNYRYVTWADGKTIESSYQAKAGAAPLTSLLPGMVKGLTGQTVGSRVLLVIPPADAYPDGNAKPSVAPNQTLVMVVDLLFTASSG
jgi:peptidylprolyl isomerase